MIHIQISAQISVLLNKTENKRAIGTKIQYKCQSVCHGCWRQSKAMGDDDDDDVDGEEKGTQISFVDILITLVGTYSTISILYVYMYRVV